MEVKVVPLLPFRERARAFVRVSDRQVGRVVVHLVASGIRHPERIGDLLANKVEVVLARDGLHDLAEQHEARVAVGPLGPRLELERLLRIQGSIVLYFPEPFLRRALILVIEVASHPRGMSQELMDGHLFAYVSVRPGGQVLSDLVVEGELSLLRELRDRDRGEHLVHRAEVELGVHAIRSLEGSAREAPRPLNDDFPLPRHHHRTGELIGGGELGHVRFDLLRQSRVIEGADPARDHPKREREDERSTFPHSASVPLPVANFRAGFSWSHHHVRCLDHRIDLAAGRQVQGDRRC